MKTDFNTRFAAVAVGNVLEWFDFAVFGAFADVIGEVFFPGSSPDTQMLKSLSVFGAAFAMRPVGGVIMGWIGDVWGRKRALEVSIALMLFPSFLIGCLPSYASCGIWATIGLVFLRLLQGLAVGGELVGAFIYTVESTGGQHRGYWGASCKATGNLGTTLGMGIAALLRGFLSKEQLFSWGWRIPFWSGIVLGLLGIYLRSKIEDDKEDSEPLISIGSEGVGVGVVVGEGVGVGVAPRAVAAAHQDNDEERNDSAGNNNSLSSITAAASSSSTATTATTAANTSAAGSIVLSSAVQKQPAVNPIVDVLTHQCGTVVVTALITSFWGCAYYSTFVWMSYFMSDGHMVGGGSQGAVPYAWIVNFAMNSLLVVLFPFAGILGDHFQAVSDRERLAIGCAPLADAGFKRAMVMALVICLVLAVPAFMLICTRTIAGALVGQGIFAVSLALFGGNLPAFLVAQFPVSRRFTGVGIAYNTANALFAGTAPFIQTTLVLKAPDSGLPGFGNRLYPAVYISAVCLLSLFCLLVLHPRLTSVDQKIPPSPLLSSSSFHVNIASASEVNSHSALSTSLTTDAESELASQDSDTLGGGRDDEQLLGNNSGSSNSNNRNNNNSSSSSSGNSNSKRSFFKSPSASASASATSAPVPYTIQSSRRLNPRHLSHSCDGQSADYNNSSSSSSSSTGFMVGLELGQHHHRNNSSHSAAAAASECSPGVSQTTASATVSASASASDLHSSAQLPYPGHFRSLSHVRRLRAIGLGPGGGSAMPTHCYSGSGPIRNSSSSSSSGSSSGSHNSGNRGSLDDSDESRQRILPDLRDVLTEPVVDGHVRAASL